MPTRPVKLSAILICYITSLTYAGDAQASGFLVARFGSEHGHPTTDNPTAIYFNPAGLALGKGTRVYAEGLFAYRTAEYIRPQGAIDNVIAAGDPAADGTPIAAVDANSGPATLGNAIASPFLGVVTDLGLPNLGVGLAFYVPFGGSAEWDQNEDYAGDATYPGAVDGPQRWFTIEGSIRSAYITLGGAYRWPCIGLSVGGGLNVIYSTAETIRARNFDSSDDLVNAQGGVKEGRSYIDVSGWTFSLGAGVIWEPTDKVWLGASYQSQPGFGKTRMSGVMRNQFGAGQPSIEDIELEQALPDVLRVGGRFRPAKNVELRAFGELVRWSHLDKQCILSPDGVCSTTATGATAPDGDGILAVLPRSWEDAFGFRAGGSYHATETVEAFAGIGYDQNAIPDETLEPTFIDADKLSFSLGGRFGLLQRALALTVTLTHVYYFEREVGAQPDLELPSRIPDARGTYTHGVTFLNLAAEYAF